MGAPLRKHVAAGKQRGVVLILTLILLGVFSVIVVSMVTSSNVNFQVAGNQQYRLEAKSAARNGVESYLSNPANFQLPLPSVDSLVTSDFNGDGVADMTATVPPPDCLRSIPIPILQLDIADPQDAQCVVGTMGNANSGIASDEALGASSNSWCSKMNWDVRAAVADAKTGAAVEMHQGVYVRAIIGTPCLSNDDEEAEEEAEGA